MQRPLSLGLRRRQWMGQPPRRHRRRISRRPLLASFIEKKMYSPSRDQLSRFGVPSVFTMSSASAAPLASR